MTLSAQRLRKVRNDITTCAPTLALSGTGGTSITTITDNLGTPYAVGNDDCSDPWSVPLLAGWTCNNSQGLARMSCAAPSPAGFRISSGAADRLTVSVCRYGTDGGIAPLYIWYDAATTPNPG